MIRVKAGDLGEFKIIKTRFVEGTQEAFKLYQAVMDQEEIGLVHDGPVDYHLARRICSRGGVEMEIIEEDLEETDSKGRPYVNSGG